MKIDRSKEWWMKMAELEGQYDITIGNPLTVGAMKYNIKQLWLSQLTSTQYKKAVGMLRDGDKFCPLGILCELYRLMTGNGEWEKKAGIDVFTLRNQMNIPVMYEAMPPQEVLDWAGVSKDDALTIQNLNDGQVGNGVNEKPLALKDVAYFIENFL